MQRKVTAASSHLLRDPQAHLSVVETGRIDFHQYFTGFKRRNGPFHDTHIMVQGFILLLVLAL
jgi:hypothetical protein